MNPMFLRVGQTLNLSLAQRIRMIYLPALVPPISTGLRLGFGIATVGALLSEIKLSNKGLGHAAMQAYARFDIPTMMAILIVLGFFIDEVSMMMITLPFFMPLVQQMGVDPIWFGVLFLINMQIGLLSPPFGLLLFAMKGVAPPHITMAQVIGSVMPYLYFGIAVMILVFFWPELATWLPRLFGA